MNTLKCAGCAVLAAAIEPWKDDCNDISTFPTLFFVKEKYPGFLNSHHGKRSLCLRLATTKMSVILDIFADSGP